LSKKSIIAIIAVLAAFAVSLMIIGIANAGNSIADGDLDSGGPDRLEHIHHAR
jgi:hypothetical protein